MKKVYVVGSSKGYAGFLKDYELVDDMETADIVLFTGGEDVTPSYYGCKKHRSTYNNPARDKIESGIFKKVSPSQLVVGICRGSQFCCAMNGGRLVQNVSGHALWGTHGIIDSCNTNVYQITSTHHQMQYPYNLEPTEYDVLYKAFHDDRFSSCLSAYYEGDKIVADDILQHGEPEIVLYHKNGLPKCLAIQGHPEMMPSDAPVVEMLNDLIDSLI